MGASTLDCPSAPSARVVLECPGARLTSFTEAGGATLRHPPVLPTRPHPHLDGRARKGAEFAAFCTRNPRPCPNLRQSPGTVASFMPAYRARRVAIKHFR